MVHCPECGKNVDADFGMANCAACGAVFMVEIDGSVNTSDESPIVDEEPPPLEENLQDNLSDSEDALPVELEPIEDLLDEQAEFSTDTDTDASPTLFQTDSKDTNDPLGLQKFDQSAASELSDGEFLYDVFIKGLDSADLKKDVLEALSDKRFSFSPLDLRRNIHRGDLNLPDLNPVRAMLVVLKLQEFDVDVEWRQKHFSRAGEVTLEAKE